MADFLSTAQGVPIDYLAQFSRRGGGTGGAAKGALGGFSTAASIAPMTGPAAPFVMAGGALAGAIGGAIGKHAKSAPTDLSVANAKLAIAKAYADANGGRAPDPGYIDQALAGQGLKPGGQWVGSGGLNSVIQSIQANAAREQGRGPGSQPAVSGGQQIGYRPGRELLDSGNKAALLRILGGA